MNRLLWKIRNSLAFKVIILTATISLGVVWVTGSALNSRLTDGIRQVNLNSAFIEARSTIYTAQYRLLFAENESNKQIQKIIDDVVSSATTFTSNENAREVVFLSSPGKKSSKNYEIASNNIKPSTIPNSLRTEVQASVTPISAYTQMKYAEGQRIPGVAVGQKITIPKAGSYEMYLIFSLASEKETLDLIDRFLLFAGILLMFSITLITWLVVRQVLKPVRNAAQIATEFTAGDFRKRMQVTSQDEISILGHAFNEMAESIEKQIARLQNLSQVQQRFVSDVSHELRTPLTTLRMASEVINSSKTSFDPTVSRSAELLLAQLDRFERLLEDLLEVSRFDAEVAQLEIVDFDIVLLTKRCVEDLALVAKQRKTVIYVNSKEPIILLRADIRRVERIMRNLLSNAIDHAEEIQINVNIQASEHDVAVSVRDFGVGLDEISLLRVFDRFWRADPSRARTRGGTGLGLSIALEDARLHNGELEAWGRPGRGAHFVLTLPRKENQSIRTRLIPLKPEDFTP